METVEKNDIWKKKAVSHWITTFQSQFALGSKTLRIWSNLKSRLRYGIKIHLKCVFMMIFAWSLSVNEKRANDFYGRSKKSYKCADRFSVIITLKKSHMYQTLVFSVLEHVFLLRGRHPRVHISESPSVNRHWIASNNDRWLNRIILVTSQYMWLDRLNDNSSHWGVLGPLKGISLGVAWCR